MSIDLKILSALSFNKMRLIPQISSNRLIHLVFIIDDITSTLFEKQILELTKHYSFKKRMR